MNTKILFLLSIPLTIMPTYGQSIYKCTDSTGKVNYQQTPCPDMGDAIMNYKSRPIFTPRFSKNHIPIMKSINEDRKSCSSIKDNLSKNECLQKVDERIQSECQYCFKGDEQILRIRAEDWSNLLSSIDKMSEKQAITAMEEYLEPSAATKQRALEYYEIYNKSKNLKKSSSVDNVRIDNEGELGEVRYTSIHGAAEKELKTYTETTNWIKKGGIWYRTIESSIGRFNN